MRTRSNGDSFQPRLLLTSAATLISPRTLRVPEGPQSEPIHTGIFRSSAAGTSVVLPYSQTFENGDQTIAPGSVQAAYSSGLTAFVWMAMNPRCRQPQRRALWYSRATMELGWPSAQ
jgi:hypothetical protein